MRGRGRGRGGAEDGEFSEGSNVVVLPPELATRTWERRTVVVGTMQLPQWVPSTPSATTELQDAYREGLRRLREGDVSRGGGFGGRGRGRGRGRVGLRPVAPELVASARRVTRALDGRPEDWAGVGAEAFGETRGAGVEALGAPGAFAGGGGGVGGRL